MDKSGSQVDEEEYHDRESEGEQDVELQLEKPCPDLHDLSNQVEEDPVGWLVLLVKLHSTARFMQSPWRERERDCCECFFLVYLYSEILLLFNGCFTRENFFLFFYFL